MGRKRSLSDEEYSPALERRRKKNIANRKRKKEDIQKMNKQRNKEDIQKMNKQRKKEDRQKENKQRKKEDIQKMNKQRKKDDIKRANAGRKKRKMKSDISGMEFDLSSPFPPTLEQVNLCGHILSNSVAALFSQQSPPAEISYSVMVVEQLKLYITPIIEHTMYCFNQECCFQFSGDLNLAKASANKALNTLAKLLLFNNYYQLMSDFEI